MIICIHCKQIRERHGYDGSCQAEGYYGNYFTTDPPTDTVGEEAKEILDDIRTGNLGEVIDRRRQVYGDPEESFIRVAQVWSGILGHEVQATDVPLLMIGYKMVRATYMPDYSDNSDDIEGYLDIFKLLVGEDMIHARSVSDFIAMKWGEDA